MAEPSERWYTTAEVADRWRCRPEPVSRLAGQKKLRGAKLGGQWRFRLSDIEAYEEASYEEASSSEPAP